MKASAIVRIILLSFVVVLLTAILIVGIVGWRSGKSFFNTNFLNFSSGTVYENADDYTVGGAEIPCDGINSIEVNWTRGKVILARYDGDVISLSEDGGLSESDRLRYLVKDGKLTVQFRKSEHFYGSVVSKTLTLLIPESLALSLRDIEVDLVSAVAEISNVSGDSLEVYTVSGDVELIDVSCTDADIDGVSGDVKVDSSDFDKLVIGTVSGAVEVRGTSADTVKCETVSGRITLDGKFAEISADSTSGAVNITDHVAPTSVEVETVSGNISLLVPNDCGFTASLDSMSGKLSCGDFAVVVSGKKYVHGDGSAVIDLSSTSGNAQIGKCAE